MQIPTLAEEDARVEALHALRLLDTPPEERFDAVTRLATAIFQTPIAMVSMVDATRQWFKSRVGLKICETSRDISFCTHALLGDEALVIPDAHADPRFADNPLVTSDPYIRFYAGHPLRGPDGHKVGTLCIADQVQREFSEAQRQLLRELAGMVERELRATDIIELQTDLLTTQRELLGAQKRLHSDIAEAAKYVRSLLPPPVQEPLQIDWRFLPSANLGGDCFGYHELGHGQFALYLLDVCGHGVGAALLSVTLLRILQSGSLAGVDFTDPAAVLTALNREFPMARHGKRFFTIWYGVIDLRTRRLRYATGGHPPAILVHPDGTSACLATNGVAIGCVPHWPFDAAECALQSGQTLYVFSDGGYEVRNAVGEYFTLDQFAALLAQPVAAHDLDALLAEVWRLTGTGRFNDDVSIIKLQLP
ncbi:MAG: SpoIIE family protein phosphatase [Verrucomicrobia bacterium]|nr:SpoIIE family protein phosphatase [Verrucomicrobiota bacterium]